MARAFAACARSRAQPGQHYPNPRTGRYPDFVMEDQMVEKNGTGGTKEGAGAKSVASQLEELRTEIAAVAAIATSDDARTLTEILATAKQGERKVVAYTLTPAVMALLHSRHNPHNRDVTVAWVRELARRMKGGQWRWKTHCPGSTIRQLSDAGHRFGAGAIAGFTWQTAIVFGVQKDAITTIDDGKKRHGYDAAKLSGIKLASLRKLCCGRPPRI